MCREFFLPLLKGLSFHDFRFCHTTRSPQHATPRGQVLIYFSKGFSTKKGKIFGGAQALYHGGMSQILTIPVGVQKLVPVFPWGQSPHTNHGGRGTGG